MRVSALACASSPVVVVDDNPDILELVAIFVRDAGFATVVTTQAQHALELSRRPEVCAVVSDIHMPGMTGITLLNRIRSESEDLPVFLMSADDTQTASLLTRLGATGYFRKPLDLTKLQARLRDLPQGPRSPFAALN